MQSTISQPDLAQARAHLAALDPSPDAEFGFRAIGEAPDSFQGGALAYGTLDRAIRQSSDPAKNGKPCRPVSFLTFMQRLGAGVFVVPNALDGAGQRETNVSAIRTPYIDCDTRQAVAQAAEFIARTGLQPTLTVASGGVDGDTAKLHHYWRVTGCPVSRFRELVSILVSRTGADSACVDPSRVLRLAGFWHLKGTPRLSRIVAQSDATYHFQDFRDRIAAQPAVQPVAQLASRAASGRLATYGVPHLPATSQTERLRRHLDRLGGLIVPAVQAAIAETQHGERHLMLRAVVARLAHLHWPDADVLALLVPFGLAAWPDVDGGELAARIVKQLRWVQEREAQKTATMVAVPAHVARAFGVSA